MPQYNILHQCTEKQNTFSFKYTPLMLRCFRKSLPDESLRLAKE